MQSPSDQVVKVAIQANNVGLLFILKQDQTLEKVIQEVCSLCNLEYEKDKYAFRLLPQVSESEVYIFIMESNRYLVKNGCELKLVNSPPVMSKMITEKLIPKASFEDLSWAINKAAICSADITFCRAFYPSGYLALQNLLNESLLTKDLYQKSLKIILNLIRSNYLTDLELDFFIELKKIVTSDQHIEEAIVVTALEVLEAIVFAGVDSEFIRKLIVFDELLHHIWNRNSPTIQCNSLGLMNAMVLKCSNIKNQKFLLKKMDSKLFKDTIYTNIILFGSTVPAALAQNVYVYQSLILTLEKGRYRKEIQRQSLLLDLVPCSKSDMGNKTKTENEAAIKLKRDNKTQSLRVSGNKDKSCLSLAPPMGNSVLLSDTEETEVDDCVFIAETKCTDFKKDDYISQLTFECVLYFCNQHRDNYKVALLDEGKSYNNFLCTCERIVHILCVKVLRIGNIPENGETGYCPLVFSTVFPFMEELFSKAINLLYKTKREMKAKTASDLEKVYQVFQRQLVEALASKPLNFDQLEAVLGTLSYWSVKDRWEEEQIQREQHKLANSPAIQHLCQSLVTEIQEVVKKQRLQFIKTGTEFPVWNPEKQQRVKNRTWFAFLAPNEKAIQYYENKGEVNQLLVQNITSLATGKRCPHVKNYKSRATNGELTFSLKIDESSLDFVAPSQEVYDHWTDAINVLLGNEMKSVSMKRDMKCLMEMELRIRLLDTEGIDLPHDPPPIPLDPPNYNFCHPEAS